MIGLGEEKKRRVRREPHDRVWERRRMARDGQIKRGMNMNKTKVELNGKNILVTGSPGFIGANIVMRLLKEMNSGTVISFDMMNDYYDPRRTSTHFSWDLLKQKQ